MILYFAPGGRLGNQLFQASYIERIRKPGERVFCTRMGSGLRFARGLRGYLNTDNLLIRKFCEYYLEPLIRSVLVPLGLVTSIVEIYGGVLVERRGRLPITYLKGNFQFCELLHPGTSPGFGFPQPPVEKARRILEEARGRTPLFVHVRRGDYLKFAEADPMNPLLPASYYRDAMKLLLDAVPDPHFFFLGDDPRWCADEFPELEHATIARHSEPVDLALMSLCAGGLVANSTFAWWGAFFCRRTAPIVAPRYWIGWRSETWFPARIPSEFLTYIDVRA